MNWKDQGYIVGNKAYLVNRTMWNNVVTNREEVEIIYVGTTKLKVKYNDELIEFKNKTRNISSTWGHYYEIYLNEKEFIRIREENRERKELSQKLKSLIGNASLDKLKAIEKMIKENK